MKLRGLIDEDFINYKKPSMFLIFPYCTLKCDIENKINVCQNSSLLKEPIIEINDVTLACRYFSNKITNSIVCGGLEPLDSFDDLINFINIIRNEFKCNDDIVIYTGYTENEIKKELTELEKYINIIVKFGRFIPNNNQHFDEVLGCNLSSDNQYSKKIS